MANPTPNTKVPRPPRLYAALLGVVALVLVVGGGRLLSLGGSPYYLLAGLAVGGSAVLLWKGRAEGAWLFAAMLVATTAWAVWESGFDGWALAPRLIGPMVLGLWLLTPGFRRRVAPSFARPGVARFARPLGFVAALVVALALGAGLHLLRAPLIDPAFTVVASAPAFADPAAASAYPAAAADWPSYGGDPGGRRFSALDQLSPHNVSKLKVAWTYHVGPGPKDAQGTLEINPLKVGDTVYLCSGFNDIIALDAETGKPRWRYDAHVNAKSIHNGTCRGVAYFKATTPVADCPERIITNTVDARLIAVDAHTGALCRSFGTKGQTSLLTGMGKMDSGYYYVSSAPTIIRGKIVLGGWVSDGQYWGEPSGVIRAFDATTGQFAWAFDMGREQDHKEPAPGQTYTHSTPNAWAPMSADETLGLVYAPTGNATPDYYGAQRRPFDDKYSSSVVALDAGTGQVRWAFQTTHHDLWDYDVASQPTLVDVPVAGGGVQHALLAPTKRGEIFMLDRVTGKPLATVQERPVSTVGGAPGERLSPTQPFSAGMPSFRGPDLRESMMWGLTPLDQLYCRIKFREARYEGPLTPPGPTANIAYPGYLGGVDWGSVSVDAKRHLMIVSSSRLANYDRLITRAVADQRGLKPASDNRTVDLAGAAPQGNTPYAAEVSPFLSPLGAPCQQPPYGMLTAVDLTTHKVVWARPIGTAKDSGPLGLHSMLPIPMGAPLAGGSITTRSGLVFIAATQEKAIRAIDIATGKTLWKAPLSAGGQSTPTTYLSAASGRQFVVIAAGGNLALRTGVGDEIIAYAIPKL